MQSTLIQKLISGSYIYIYTVLLYIMTMKMRMQ